MPTPREKRLQTDYQKIQQLVAGSGDTLRLVSVKGSPPSLYVLEYRCPGLAKEGGRVTVRDEHRVEIQLDLNYPFSKPSARLLTPVFNPHVFVTRAVCLGMRWTPLETLDALALRIGAILQLDPKVLDFKSLANGEAGAWVRAHPDQTPLPGAVSFKAPRDN
jgi:ubiquitin-protein ligase